MLDKNVEQALVEAKKMTFEYFEDSMILDIEVKISHLINLCGDLRGKYDIGQIKSNKMATAKTVDHAKVDKDIETADLSKNLIECPIIMDEDVPQIMVD